jgi:hypothetical protein
MTNTFVNKTSRAIGNTNTRVAAYTVAAATTAIVIGVSCANILTAAISVTVQVHDGTNFTNVITNAPIPVGGSLVLTDQQKIVLQTGYGIYVQASVASAVDVIMSILEIT